MRDCRQLLETMKERDKKQFDFIRKKLLEMNSNNEYIYFLGIRNNYLSLYYKGMCMARIRISDNSSEITYSTHNYYVSGKKSSNYIQMNFEDFCNHFECIKKHIEGHVSGVHDKRKRQEKICQQWIMNKNNADPDSEWYFLDMEYVLDSNPFGRIDMIAVKRNADINGKHEVALIELKVGKDSYRGLKGAQYRKSEEKYKSLKNDLYQDSKLKFGSGLVSHITDFMRLLYDEKHYCQIKAELVQIISAYKKLGLIDRQNSLYEIDDAEKLAKKPDVYILSYAHVPNMEDAKETALSSMKTSFYNYLYLSTYCLYNMINKDQIDGILEKEKEFCHILKDDGSNIIECRQLIGKQEYNFIFQFIDPKEMSSSWRCLK